MSKKRTKKQNQRKQKKETVKKQSCKLFPDNPDCLESADNRPTIVIKEKQSEYKGNNVDRKFFCRYRVDECILNQSGGKQCDFLLINGVEKICYFIELKGSDLIKAVEQLDKTITALKGILKDYDINGRIVLTRVNITDLRNTKYIRLKNRLKKLGGTLEQQSQKFQENL